MSLKVGIVGAAGYAGAELIRLVLGHPEFELVAITSNADAGQPLSAAYPSFAGVSDLVFTTHEPRAQELRRRLLGRAAHGCHGSGAALLAAGVSCIDLSADYRLSDPATFEAWYAAEHTSPELLKTRAFGLPELFSQDLETAASDRADGKPVLVACAGCYPTATSLAAAPAVRAGWVAENGPVIVDAISGVTGAGKSCNARTHFCSADENLEAYGVGKHRHTPEIEQILGLTDRVVFTPHLAPLKRGLLSTVTLPLTPQAIDSLALEDVVDYYKQFYAGRTFVRVLDAGQQPKTASVVGTNAAQIGLAFNKRAGVLVATGAIDNLCKGAAGQAVQCANIVFGFDERRGLPTVACPV